MITAFIVSLLVTSLALNAQTLQGKVVRVADGDAHDIGRYEWRNTKVSSAPDAEYNSRKVTIQKQFTNKTSKQ